MSAKQFEKRYGIPVATHGTIRGSKGTLCFGSGILLAATRDSDGKFRDFWLGRAERFFFHAPWNWFPDPWERAARFVGLERIDKGGGVTKVTGTKMDLSALDAVPEEHQIISVHRKYTVEWRMTDTHHPILKGARDYWPEREFQATCSGSAEVCRLHLAMCAVEGPCFCGIHGMKDREKIAVDAMAGQVIAECTLYGWVFPYTEGYRAEYGRIDHMWLVTHGKDPAPEEKRLAEVLSKQYGVPCETQPYRMNELHRLEAKMRQQMQAIPAMQPMVTGGSFLPQPNYSVDPVTGHVYQNGVRIG